MKFVFWLVLAWIIFLPLEIEARPITFGFFYTDSALKELGGKSVIEKRLYQTVRETEKVFKISLAVNFVRPLPFAPPLLTPPGENEIGIFANQFFYPISQYEQDTKIADFIFVITPTVIWIEEVLGTKTSPIIIVYIKAQGAADRVSYRYAILRGFREQRPNLFTEILWHEWGHLLKVEPPDPQTCQTTRFVMCEIYYPELPLRIEHSLRQAARALAERYAKEK